MNGLKCVGVNGLLLSQRFSLREGRLTFIKLRVALSEHIQQAVSEHKANKDF